MVRRDGFESPTTWFEASSSFSQFSAIPHYDKPSYVEVLKRFAGLRQRFPSIRWLLVMAPPIQYFTEGEDWVFPEELDSLFDHETVMLEVCYPITWGGRFHYPYPEIQGLIRSLRDRFSASKLVWGSDMPNVERFCTYRQSIDYIRLSLRCSAGFRNGSCSGGKYFGSPQDRRGALRSIARRPL